MSVRERILGAALEQLYEHGFGELTQPKVAKLAGVSQSHLTYYFPTRADLLLAVAEFSLDHLMRDLVDSPPPGDPSFAERMVRELSDTRRARLMLGLVIAADEDPRIREAMQRFIATIRGRMQGLLQHLGIPLNEDAVGLFHAMAVGLAILNLARQAPDGQDELHRQLGIGLLLWREAAPHGPWRPR